MSAKAKISSELETLSSFQQKIPQTLINLTSSEIFVAVHSNVYYVLFTHKNSTKQVFESALTISTPSVFTTKRLSEVSNRNLVRSVQSVKPTENRERIVIV